MRHGNEQISISISIKQFLECILWWFHLEFICTLYLWLLNLFTYLHVYDEKAPKICGAKIFFKIEWSFYVCISFVSNLSWTLPIQTLQNISNNIVMHVHLIYLFLDAYIL